MVKLEETKSEFFSDQLRLFMHVANIDKIMHKTFYMTLHLDKIKNLKKVFTLQKEHYLLFGN